jgi:hypothetical protein
MSAWAIFADQPTALAGVATINSNMGLPVNGSAVTTTWAVPRQTGDGKWAIPDAGAAMAGVIGSTGTDAPAWPVVAGMI